MDRGRDTHTYTYPRSRDTHVQTHALNSIKQSWFLAGCLLYCTSIFMANFNGAMFAALLSAERDPVLCPAANGLRKLSSSCALNVFLNNKWSLQKENTP